MYVLKKDIGRVIVYAIGSPGKIVYGLTENLAFRAPEY